MPMEDPLVLDSTACRYGTSCTKLDCERSHTSAAQMFLLEKGVLPPEGGGATISPLQQQLQAAAPMASAFIASSPPPQAPKLASVPCKFQQNCTNASCHFMHFQPRSSAHASFSSPTRAGSGAAGGASKIACRFGAACTRASCSFAHPAGRAMDIVGGAMELDREDAKKGRLARFATGPTPVPARASAVAREKEGGTDGEAAEGKGEKKEKEEEGYQSSATIKSDEEAVVV